MPTATRTERPQLSAESIAASLSRGVGPDGLYDVVDTPRISRRVMLPVTEQMTPEAAGIEDARKMRYAVSPSYYLSLGSLSGNNYTGYEEIFPRTLYRFEAVNATGINEDPRRLDEKQPQQSRHATMRREPKTCAEDVRSEAGDRVFAILNSLTGREDAQDLWDTIYPVEVEAKIWAATKRSIRGEQVPDYLRSYYRETGVESPFVKEGYGLLMFIDHLENLAPSLILRAGFDEPTLKVAEAALRDITNAANKAYGHRAQRLNNSFGLRESQRTSGIGKRKLDDHDRDCIAETGIKQPEDKPVEASQRMGTAMGEAIAERNAQTENQLTDVVRQLAENQRAMAEDAAKDRALLFEILRGRSEPATQ